MLRQAENRVKIEGILSEIDIKTSTFKKDGRDMDAIGGTIIVKVTQKMGDQDKELAIPVHMFAAKFTNKGTPNPAYASIEKIANDFVSIASAGDEAKADCVRLTNASVRMNEYYSQNGNFVSFPRINSSFFQKVRKDELEPEATFNVQFVVTNKAEEVDANGDVTGRYIITGALPQYGDVVDVVKFYCESEGVINAVSTYWEIGDTVQAHGKLNFSQKTETITEESDFGDAISRQRTISVSEPIITGGTQEPLGDELSYTNDEIRDGLARRKAKLEAEKDKAAHKAAPQKNVGFDDLGF